MIPGIGIAVPSAAHAQAATVTCTGTSTITYEPGLTLTPRDVIYSEVDNFETRAHDGLAHAYHAMGRHEQARRHWQHALNILTSLGTDHTEDIEASVPNIRAHLAETMPSD